MTNPEINLAPDGRAATISYPDGRRRTVTAERLWDACPGARAERRRIDGASAPPAGVMVTGLTDVGYGIHIAFSDDAHGGVFPWQMIFEIAQRPQAADFITPRSGATEA